MPCVLLEPAAAISEEEILCFLSYPFFFFSSSLNCLMNSPNLLVSVPQSHFMKICVGCFGSRGECEGPWQWHVIADIPLFPSRGEALINQTVSSARFSPGLPDTERSHPDCWVLGQTIAFTRNGFLGFTEPSIKKQLFLSLTVHFPPLLHLSLCPFQILNNSVYDFFKEKKEKARAMIQVDAI